MKKFFAIAIIVSALAACNNSGSSSETKDTTVAPVDTTAPATMDTSSKMMTDTTKKMDTSAKKK